MISRRFIFFVSFVIASVAYFALLYYVAPAIAPLSRTAAPETLVRKYQVRLADAAVKPRAQGETRVTPLASRPDSIRDMLTAFDAPGVPDVTPKTPSTEVPGMAERLTRQQPELFEPMPAEPQRLAAVDMHVVEIATEQARRMIEAPRRLARPSPVNVFDDAGMPSLRGPINDTPAPIRISPSGGSLLADSLAPGAAPTEMVPGSDSGQIHEERFEPAAQAPSLPPLLQEEMRIAQGPVLEAVRREHAERYEFMDDLLDIRMETYVPANEPRGYFRLKVLPRAGVEVATLPKDLIFVVDASSSIIQRKLDLTVRGLLQVIDSLREEDRFNVVIFRDNPIPFRPDPVYATPGEKGAARVFLEGLQSRGQTNFYRALEAVITNQPRTGSPGMLVVVTDGRPTTGIQDSRAIINALSTDNRRNGIYAFAGGNTVNTYLLDMLAYRNRGAASFVSGIEDVANGLPRFFQTISDPVLVNLRAGYGRIEERDVFPRELPDLFAGRGLTVYGRFDPATQERFVMRLSGKAGPREKDVVFRANLEEGLTGDSTIAKEWAYAKAYHLIGEMSRLGEQPQLVEQLRELNRTYGVRTAYDQ
jgi:hypothetical protein